MAQALPPTSNKEARQTTTRSLNSILLRRLMSTKLFQREDPWRRIFIAFYLPNSDFCPKIGRRKTTSTRSQVSANEGSDRGQEPQNGYEGGMVEWGEDAFESPISCLTPIQSSGGSGRFSVELHKSGARSYVMMWGIKCNENFSCILNPNWRDETNSNDNF